MARGKNIIDYSASFPIVVDERKEQVFRGRAESMKFQEGKENFLSCSNILKQTP